jgi:hypothetical protein
MILPTEFKVVQGVAQPFFTSALEGEEHELYTSSRFTPENKSLAP